MKYPNPIAMLGEWNKNEEDKIYYFNYAYVELG